MYGIYLNSVGSNSTSGSATQGAKIANVWANGWRSSAILLNQTSATAVTGSIAQNNGNVGFFASGSNNTFTNNIAQGNAYGFWLTGIANTTVTGNNVLGNTTYGIYVLSSSNGNTIANNKIHDNGGATTNNGLYLVSSSNNIIAGNAISDTSSTVLPGVDSASADIIDRPRTKCVVGEVVSTGS
jgi:parallel beta-helix repeat protein